MITLGIIGVVAAMTLPVLTAGYQKRVIGSQFKRSYSNNGSHLPNQFGKDFFMFAVTPKGTWPVGLEGDKYGVRNFSNSCLRNRDVYLNGIGCTAWVIYNENMDYLHCDGLSWNGKTKCK